MQVICTILLIRQGTIISVTVKLSYRCDSHLCIRLTCGHQILIDLQLSYIGCDIGQSELRHFDSEAELMTNSANGDGLPIDLTGCGPTVTACSAAE